MPGPEEFYRIKRLPPYVFEEVNRLKARLRGEGRDVIDFGMGNPDMPTPPHIVEKLIETARKPRTNRYSASAALDGPQDCVDEIRAIYRSRRDVLVESFAKAGWEIPSPSASMFAWAPIPEGYRALGSVGFAKKLMEEADVAVAPGLGFGEHGEGFVRIGLVENEQRIRQAARNIKKMLARRNAA